MHYVLRVTLPDRPGSLHALSGACLRAGADIRSLDVIEQSGGFAVDDICVLVSDPVALTEAVNRLPRRLHRSDVISAEDAGPFRDLEMAAAPLGQTTSAVIVARRGGPRFVDRELRQLDLLAQVAVATEVAHTQRRPIERIEPSRRATLRS